MSYDPEQTISKLIFYRAESGGHRGRSVRLNGGKAPLCTATYNYAQDDQTKEMVASRIAALWNIAVGISTADLEAFVAAEITLDKLINLASAKKF